MTTTHPAPPTILTSRFTDALEYARAHHAQDVRKGTTIPYLSHLLAVSALVLEHGGDETAAIAALLHDVVEDGGGVRALGRDRRSGSGTDVAAIVEGCSDTTAQRQGGLDAAQDALPPAPRDRTARRAAGLRGRQAAQRALDPRGPARAWRRALGALQQQPAPAAVVLRGAARRVPAPPAGPALGRARPHRARRSSAASTRRTASPGSACRCEFWTTELGESGAFIDWPGCPLVVENTEAGPLVRAHVGSGGWFDEDSDLEAEIEVDLDGLRLEYSEPHERAWLIGDDHGNLRDACRRVAELSPLVTEQLPRSRRARPARDQLRRARGTRPMAIGGPRQRFEVRRPRVAVACEEARWVCSTTLRTWGGRGSHARKRRDPRRQRKSGLAVGRAAAVNAAALWSARAGGLCCWRLGRERTSCDRAPGARPRADPARRRGDPLDPSRDGTRADRPSRTRGRVPHRSARRGRHAGTHPCRAEWRRSHAARHRPRCERARRQPPPHGDS